jgi:hypothetical protein
VASWELIPAGDHFREFERFDVVACAGGAGVVQTAAAAGARVVTWDRSIDRRYHDATNAGAHVDPRTPGEKWYLPLSHWYPGFAARYAGRSLSRWLVVAQWKTHASISFARAWAVLFLAYSLRGMHIQPTVGLTITRAIWGLASGPRAALTGWLFTRTVFALREALGYS